MTAEQIAVLALSRAMEHSNQVPATRSLMYHRIGQRQQELFALAAREAPDYFGTYATSPLDGNGEIDLLDVADPVPALERIHLIEVSDPGAHATLAVGDEVSIVPLRDQDAELPPRMTLRNRILSAVGDDLDGVAELKIHYSYVPASIPATGKATSLELPEQFQDLLVVDLARDLFRRATLLPNRGALVAMMDAEEAPLLAAFTVHLKAFAGPLKARFGRDR